MQLFAQQQQQQQEGESHHYDSAKAAIRQATKELPISQERLRHIYGERGEKVNHKLESLQLSMKDQVSISRLRSGQNSDHKYWLHKIGRALNTSAGNAVGGRRHLNM